MRNALWNVFPKNRTQTAYLRLLKTPEREFNTPFDKSLTALDEVKNRVERPLETVYSKDWRGDYLFRSKS